MNQVTWHTLAHLRLASRTFASFFVCGRRVLATPTFGKATKERTSSDPLGFARPFIPSSLDRPAPGSWWNESAVGPPEPPAAQLKRPRLVLTSPTKLVSQK